MSFNLTDIADAQMRADVQRLLDCVLTAEAWNDPRTQSGQISGGGKTESRPPGHQQCKSLLVSMRRDLHAFVDRRQRVQEQAHVYEPKHIAPDSIGGIETDLHDEPMDVEPRRRRVSIDVRKGRLLAKYQSVAELDT